MRDKISSSSIKSRVQEAMSGRVRDALAQHDPDLQQMNNRNLITVEIDALERAIIGNLLFASDNPQEAEKEAFIALVKKDKAELGELYAKAIRNPSEGKTLADWFIEDAQSALNIALTTPMTPEEEEKNAWLKKTNQMVREGLDKILGKKGKEDKKSPPFERS